MAERNAYSGVSPALIQMPAKVGHGGLILLVGDHMRDPTGVPPATRAPCGPFAKKTIPWSTTTSFKYEHHFLNFTLGYTTCPDTTTANGKTISNNGLHDQ